MKITVDGMEFNISGDQDVQVINSTILAGGIKVASFNSRSTINHSANSSVIIKIEGDVKAIKCDGSVTVSGNVFGNVDCGGSATVSGDVSGSIDCGGNCRCGNVGGDIDAGGNVRCR